MALISYLLTVLAACYVLAAPTSDPSTTKQNAIDAAILNSEFRTVNETDPCNSGQQACVSGGQAICRYGSWDITPCDPSNACYAVPSATGPGTILTCTTEESALAIFQSAGLQSPFLDGAGSRAFPTMTTSSMNTSAPATPSPATSAQSSDIEVVTVTLTLPPPAFSTTLPTEVRTIDPSEAASLLSSLHAQGFTASIFSSSASAPTQAVGHCQSMTTGTSVTTGSATSVSSGASTPTPAAHAYYHVNRAARRA